jgi:hypothetical protein
MERLPSRQPGREVIHDPSDPSHFPILMILTVQPYKNTRNFSVEVDGELLAVTVYKKGALAVAAMIQGLTARNAGTAPALLPDPETLTQGLVNFPQAKSSH